jgi:major membrane immunogen (membrane-anchored lipoprotein)
MKKLIFISAMAISSLLPGCKGKDSAPAQTTEADYAAKAKQEITEENMDAELDNLENQIDADLAVEK